MKQKIFILLCTIGICISVHAKKYIVHSPDNKIKVSITADKQLIWSIDYNGERILTPSAIQMNIEGLKIQPGINPVVINAKVDKINAEQIAVVPVKQKTIRDQYTQLTLICKGDYNIIFRVYNNGAAYRFETVLKQSPIKQ